MYDDNCTFCKIIKGEIPSTKVYEDDKMYVFKDIEPKAKVHLLAIPKDHFKLLSEMNGQRAMVIAYMLSIKATTQAKPSTTCTFTFSAAKTYLGEFGRVRRTFNVAAGNS